MKKIALLALGACMFIATADAQKQTGGEKNLQVLFAPLGGNPISLNYGGISFRKFSADGTSAWRCNLFIGLNSKTDVTAGDTNGVDMPELEEVESGMTISIRPGYEKHFAGTEKLSPYWGAEVSFSMTTAKVETDNAPLNAAGTARDLLVTTKEGDGASTTFGLGLVAGFDYYIAKNLSLGAEFGFGFSTTSEADIENQSLDTDSSGNNIVVNDPVSPGGTSMNVGPNFIGQFKLGWLF